MQTLFGVSHLHITPNLPILLSALSRPLSVPLLPPPSLAIEYLLSLLRLSLLLPEHHTALSYWYCYSISHHFIICCPLHPLHHTPAFELAG